jgi:hypothetical protein
MEEKQKFVKTIKGQIIIGIVLVVVGFLAGMEYKAYQIRSILAPIVASSNSQAVEDKSYTEQIKENKGNIIDKNIGDLVEFATQNIKVDKIEESNIITPEYGAPIVAPQGAKFVFITLGVTNTTKNDVNWVTDINLVDQKDRSFSGYDKSIGYVKNYLDMRKLSPGIMETGVITYQLPNDAEHYSLVIGKGGTNDFYRISLK